MTNLITDDTKLKKEELKAKNELLLELKYSDNYLTELYSLYQSQILLANEIIFRYSRKTFHRKYFPRLIYKSDIINEKFNKTFELKSVDEVGRATNLINKQSNYEILNIHKNNSSSPALRSKENKVEEKLGNLDKLVVKLEKLDMKEQEIADLSKEFNNIKGDDKIPSNFNNNLIENQNSHFLDFLKFDLKRKIKFSDISFDSSVHDIYNPRFNSSCESTSKQDKDHFNCSVNTNNNEKIANSNLNVNSLILSNSELHSLEGQNNNNSNSLNKQDYILVNPTIDEKSINSYTNIKSKNQLNFSSSDFSKCTMGKHNILMAQNNSKNYEKTKKFSSNIFSKSKITFIFKFRR